LTGLRTKDMDDSAGTASVGDEVVKQLVNILQS
jgi:hypothetical protein